LRQQSSGVNRVSQIAAEVDGQETRPSKALAANEPNSCIGNGSGSSALAGFRDHRYLVTESTELIA
jgi:hypothetical protein